MSGDNSCSEMPSNENDQANSKSMKFKSPKRKRQVKISTSKKSNIPNLLHESSDMGSTSNIIMKQQEKSCSEFENQSNSLFFKYPSTGTYNQEESCETTAQSVSLAENSSCSSFNSGLDETASPVRFMPGTESSPGSPCLFMDYSNAHSGIEPRISRVVKPNNKMVGDDAINYFIHDTPTATNNFGVEMKSSRYKGEQFHPSNLRCDTSDTSADITELTLTPSPQQEQNLRNTFSNKMMSLMRRSQSPSTQMGNNNVGVLHNNLANDSKLNLTVQTFRNSFPSCSCRNADGMHSSDCEWRSSYGDDDSDVDISTEDSVDTNNNNNSSSTNSKVSRLGTRLRFTPPLKRGTTTASGPDDNIRQSIRKPQPSPCLGTGSALPDYVSSCKSKVSGGRNIDSTHSNRNRLLFNSPVFQAKTARTKVEDEEIAAHLNFLTSVPTFENTNSLPRFPSAHSRRSASNITSFDNVNSSHEHQSTQENLSQLQFLQNNNSSGFTKSFNEMLDSVSEGCVPDSFLHTEELASSTSTYPIRQKVFECYPDSDDDSSFNTGVSRTVSLNEEWENNDWLMCKASSLSPSNQSKKCVAAKNSSSQGSNAKGASSSIMHLQADHGMGDLGTPVTEVGSPGDIYLDENSDMYLEAELSHDFSNSSFKSLPSPTPIAMTAGGLLGSGSPMSFDRSFKELYQTQDAHDMLNYLSNSIANDCDEEFKSDSPVIHVYSGPRIPKSSKFRKQTSFRGLKNPFKDMGAANTSNEYSTELSYDSDQRSSDSTSSNHHQRRDAKPRPLPDQSAFDRNSGCTRMSSILPSPPSYVCPPTPTRSPSWSSDAADGAPVALQRQNSLVSSKLILSDSNESFSPSFIRDYINEGLIGSGSFADVFRVRYKEDGQLYAVKKCRRQFKNKRDRELIVNEVKVMQRLNQKFCKNIVHLNRAWQEDGFFYVQLDIAENGTLKGLLNELVASNRPITDSLVWHVIHDVTAGLDHIHNFGMVHLDIKPANLLIDSLGDIKIGDYGMTTDQGEEKYDTEGDNRYMAPELLDSLFRMPSADIFSLGLTLYQMCMMGKGLQSLPSHGPLWLTLREGNVDPIENRPASMTNVIKKAMSPLPSSRPSTIAILSLPEVIDARETQDETLLSAKPRVPMPPALARSASFIPLEGLPQSRAVNELRSLNTTSISSDSDMSGELRNRIMTPTADFLGPLW